MSRTRGVLLAVAVAFGALGVMPARAELKNVFVGPGRYLTGSMSKLGVTASFFGWVDTGWETGMINGQPYAGPLVEAIWGEVTVRKGTAKKNAYGLYSVTINPALGSASIRGTINGVSINVSMTADGNPTPNPFTPDPNAIAPPYFMAGQAGLDVSRTASLAGSVSAVGVGGITGGTGSGTIGATAGVYFWYA